MKSKPILNKIASVLAFVIGVMAIFAGGQVLLGILPDYYIIDWLPIYNFAAGIISAFFVAIIIWKNNRLALPSAIGIFSMHTGVMIILQTAYHEVVAPDSIKAMIVRLAVWAIIVGLLIAQHLTKQKE